MQCDDKVTLTLKNSELMLCKKLTASVGGAMLDFTPRLGLQLDEAVGMMCETTELVSKIGGNSACYCVHPPTFTRARIWFSKQEKKNIFDLLTKVEYTVLHRMYLPRCYVELILIHKNLFLC